MHVLNLHLRQVALLELYDVEYTLNERNDDGVTFKVTFDNEQELHRAINLIIRS